MAITSSICTSYKREILEGLHQLVHTYRLALFTSSATLGSATTTYTGQTGEVSGSGYSEGGIEMTGITTGSSPGAAWIDFAQDPVWSNATITARGALLYNDSLPGKNAVAVFNFGQDITSTNDDFTVVLPTPDANSALIRL